MGKIISFSGIDGCGKSTILDTIRHRIEKEGKSTRYVWLRYNHYLTKFLLGVCRIIRLTKYEYPNGIRVGYHEFYRSKYFSFLFILLTFIDTLYISIVTVYLPAIFTKKIIFCDRWVFDILVDLEIDTRINFSKHIFVKKIFKKLIPHTAVCFLIRRNLDQVKAQRIEHTYDRNFMQRFQLFERLVKDKRLIVVENNKELKSTIGNVNTILEQDTTVYQTNPHS
jgi:thymidylate kinase